MPNRPSRRLRRLILGSVITATSAGWTPLPASPPEARDHASSRPVTRTAEAYDRAVAAVPGGGQAAGLGASLWRLAEAFALVEPARVAGAAGGRGDLRVTGGKRQPPDWESRDDASFDVVTSVDLIRRELEELPSENVADETVADVQPAVADQDTEKSDKLSDLSGLVSERELGPSDRLRDASTDDQPNQPRGLSGGGSPVIVTLEWSDPHFGEEYCPYDCEGNAWIGSEWAVSPDEAVSPENAACPAADKGLSPAVVSSPSVVSGEALSPAEPVVEADQALSPEALELGGELVEQALSLVKRIEQALSPAIVFETEGALSPAVSEPEQAPSPVIVSSARNVAESTRHPRFAGIPDVPRFDYPDSQRNCLFRGAWSPRLPSPLSATDPSGPIVPLAGTAKAVSPDVEATVSPDDVAVSQEEEVSPEEEVEKAVSPDVDAAVGVFTEVFVRARTWWSEYSASVRPMNWGPQIYGWAARAEAAVSQATGQVVRRWNVRPQPKAVREGARLLARAGAVEAAEAAPKPHPAVVAERVAEAPTAEQIDQALKMLRSWWELAESHGRAARRVAGLDNADVRSR